MMITADLHTHSYFSGDSDTPTRDMAQAALEKGLRTLCLTEHRDIDYPNDEFELDVPEYKKEILRLKEEYSRRLEILFGVELGLMDNIASKLYDFTKNRDFDFIIGSSHLVNGADPYYPEYFERFGTKNGILRYFESISANIEMFDDFDVYGHLDYVVRYSPEKKYDPVDCREVIEDILTRLIRSGKGIEINTAGIRSGLSHANPHPFILKRYKELGGEIITVGSDAHRTDDIAADFEQAEEMLIGAGFKYCAVFRKRTPEFIKIT